MFSDIERFKVHLIKENLSDNTIRAYVISARTYYSKYNRISAKNIMSYQRYLEEHYSPKSANLRIIAFNKYLRFIDKPEYQLKVLKYRQATYLDKMVTRYLSEELPKGWNEKQKNMDLISIFCLTYSFSGEKYSSKQTSPYTLTALQNATIQYLFQYQLSSTAM